LHQKTEEINQKLLLFNCKDVIILVLLRNINEIG